MNCDALNVFAFTGSKQAGADRRCADSESHRHGTDDKTHRKGKTDRRKLQRAELTDEIGVGDVIGDLNSRRAKIESIKHRTNAKIIDGSVPLSEVFGYATALRSLTQGRATYTMEPSYYEEVPKNIAEKIIKGEY